MSMNLYNNDNCKFLTVHDVSCTFVMKWTICLQNYIKVNCSSTVAIQGVYYYYYY